MSFEDIQPWVTYGGGSGLLLYFLLRLIRLYDVAGRDAAKSKDNEIRRLNEELTKVRKETSAEISKLKIESDANWDKFTAANSQLVNLRYKMGGTGDSASTVDTV